MKLQEMLAALCPESAPVVEKSILAQAKAQVAKENAEKVMKVTVEVLGRLENYKNNQLSELRVLRRKLKETLKNVENIDRALKWADKTGNIAPAIVQAEGNRGLMNFCRTLGCDVPDEKSDILKVPADFKE